MQVAVEYLVPMGDDAPWGLLYDDHCWLVLRPAYDDDYKETNGWWPVAWIHERLHATLKNTPLPSEHRRTLDARRTTR
jgi:hypothetical protein